MTTDSSGATVWIRTQRGRWPKVTVRTMLGYEYPSIVALRYRAYLAADLVDRDTTQDTWEDDEFDRRSTILVAKIGEAIVGTVRLIFCRSDTDRFLFEKDIEFAKLNATDRTRFVEVSRFAVEPGHVKADIAKQLIIATARHAIANGKAGICLARTVQRSTYSKYGFALASPEIPHPRLMNQTLALMTWNSEQFIKSGMRGTETQKAVLREVINL